MPRASAMRSMSLAGKSPLRGLTMAERPAAAPVAAPRGLLLTSVSSLMLGQSRRAASASSR
eukprot:1349209-Alexandrium_andersonii.AAC.1